jgi:hypothetical protein
MMMMLLAGCGGSVRTTTDAPTAGTLAEAADIRQALGTASAVVAQTTVSLHQKDHDAVRFDLTWWCGEDGRVKVVASQHDVDFVCALAGRDGSYQAMLPRERVHCSGVSQAAATPWLLTAVLLAGAELRGGPLPADAAPTSGPGPHLLLLGACQGVQAQATLDPAAREVISKRLFGADDAELVTVSYQRYQAFDEIRRASVLTLSFPDGTEATLYVRQLRSVGRISAEGMHLHVPSGSVVVDLQDFLSRLEHVGNG